MKTNKINLDNIPLLLKIEIDKMSYETMLYKCRYEPTGSKYFQGDTGDYFVARMQKLKEEVGDAEHVKVSKAIGWKQ